MSGTTNTETYTITGAQFANGSDLSGYVVVEYSDDSDSPSTTGTIISADLSADGQNLIYNVAGQTQTVSYTGVYNLSDSISSDPGLWQTALNQGGGRKLVLNWVTETPVTVVTNEYGGNPTSYYMSGFAQGGSAAYLTNGGTITESPVCYLRGTFILTDRGEIPVEELQPGDLVATRFGPLRPIKWIGRQSFAGRFLGRTKAPVCFRAGAIADNVPVRDLYVSPEHSVVINDTLVVAKHLVNGISVIQTPTDKQVDYFHIDLGSHDCVVANGAWAETYAEQNNRTMFHNHDDFAAVFPDHQYSYQEMCLPRTQGNPEAIWPIRAQLLDRLPAECLTTCTDLHILADGARIEATQLDARTWEFLVPARTTRLRLVSNASKPCMVQQSNDSRLLGFCIEKIAMESSQRSITINAHDTTFSLGVHKVETRGTRTQRWTTGNCPLPAILLGDAGEAVKLTITGNGLKRYLRPATTAASPALQHAA